MTQNQLFQYAEDHNIDVDWCILSVAESLSIPLVDGTCAIAMDPTKFVSDADVTWKLSHELGHCETGSFYCRYTPFDERARHEERANRWAINHVLPFSELFNAIESGLHEAWELAEFFGVPEEMVQKAIAYYTGPCGLSFQKILPEEC